VGGSRVGRWLSWPASPRSRATVYLGGTLGSRGSAGWRCEILDLLGDQGGVEFVSPELAPGLTFEDTVAVAEWEKKQTGRASVVVLYFGSCYRVDAGLRELDGLLASGRVVVCCPFDVACRDRVVDVCSAVGVLVCSSLEGAATCVRSMLGARHVLESKHPVSVAAPPLVPGSERLEWDAVCGYPVVSGFERKSGAGAVLVATFQSSHRVVGGLDYVFRVPGEAGLARWRCSEGLRMLGDVAVDGGYFILRCGASYCFRLSYSLSSFAPTFEYPFRPAHFGLLSGSRCEFFRA